MNYEVYERNLTELQSRLARLSKQVQKAGGAPITLKPTGVVRDEPHPTQPNALVRVVEVEVNGDMPTYNGWNFLATIVHTAEGNVTKSVPGYQVPAEYRDGKPCCDHCKQNRFRRDTYIVRHEDGRTLQVGSSCLKDFLGHAHPEQLTRAAEVILSMFTICEAAKGYHWLGGSNGHEPFRVDLESYLSAVAALVRQGRKFITRKIAKETETTSTSDIAWNLFRNPETFCETERPNDTDRETAKAAIDWVIASYAPSVDPADHAGDVKAAVMGFTAVNRELSDFEHNLLTLARSEAFEPRLRGIAAYIIEAYRRDQARKAAERAPQLNTAGLPRIFAMFKTASAQLKYPAIRMVTEQGQHMTLSLAGAQSKNAGCIYVKGAKGSDTYFGKITPQGKFYAVGGCPATIEPSLKAFADQPEEWATKYGRLTGCCCFCGRSLTDERSTDVGYGPVCAERYGLGWGAHKTEKCAVPDCEAPATTSAPIVINSEPRHDLPVCQMHADSVVEDLAHAPATA